MLFFLLILLPFVNTVGQNSKTNKVILTGIVKDSENNPLIGATVSVKGTSIGTLTDLDGKFKLRYLPSKDKLQNLQVVYMGYKTKEQPIANKTFFTFTLLETNKELNEVVVVGYGVQKKANLTGAVEAIKGSELTTTKNENVENMLTGKMGGVRIVQKSSEPGSFDNSFDIRGLGAPLVIIDGIPRDNFTRIDPNDIESISVLKDATAAIYGVRAANGVVLITTKRGKKGALSLEYSGNIGWQNPTGSPKSASAADWMELRNEKSMHNPDGGNRPYSQEEIQAYRSGLKRGTDWWNECMRPLAPQTQHSLTITGGTDKVNFFVSGGYLDQQSFLRSKDLDYKRYNIRSNITMNLSKRFMVNLNVDGIMDEKNQPKEDAYWIIRLFQITPAIQPVYANDDPRYLQYGYIEGMNPIAMENAAQSGNKKMNNKWFQSSISASYKVPYIEGLTLKGLFSYDFQISDNSYYSRRYDLYDFDKASGKYIPKAYGDPTNFRRDFHSYLSTLSQLSLNYDHTFNSKHNVSALLLLEGRRKKGDNFFAQRDLGLDLPQLFAGNAQNQIAYMDPNGIYESTNIGIVGKLGYNYASKYIAEFAFREDGSSLFAPGHRWGFFPSITAGWRISEENFWKNSLSFIDNFKIRASYGKLGDDSAAGYQFLNGYYYPQGGYVFDGKFINAAVSKGIPNPYITWFVSKTLDVGADLDAWNGLLGINFDFFSRTRTGLLAKRNLSLPSTIGADLPDENINSDLARGFELTLSHRFHVGDFKYNLKGILSYTRIQSLYQERSRSGNSYENWLQNGNNRNENIHWGWGGDGRFQSYDDIARSPVYYNRGTLPGDYIYQDWNGDGRIDDLDRHPIGYQNSQSPFLNFSFMIGAEWKNWDLNVLLQGAAMGDVQYDEQLREPLWGNEMSNALDFFTDRWHPKYPNADPYDKNTEWIPGKYPYTGTLPEMNSIYNLHDISYMRLKSVEIGYTIPSHITMKAHIKSARVYVNGYNLLTLKSVELDPEHPSDNWGYNYPLSRTFSFGVNVKF